MSMSYEGGCEGNICLLLLRLGGESSSGSRERDDVERPPLAQMGIKLVGRFCGQERTIEREPSNVSSSLV